MFSLSELIIAIVTTAFLCIFFTWLITFSSKKSWAEKVLVNLKAYMSPDDFTTEVEDIITGRNFDKEVERKFKKYFKP